MFDFKWKDNGSIKLLIIVGTRPEIIRLAATIKRCREYFDCCVAHTGQNYDKNLNDIFWSDFELGGPDVWMNVVGDNLGQTCGNVVARSYELMAEIKPDALLVLGDTNSCLSAISAKRLHIPIFHMEAGNRCKDECLPEETNRRIVDVISDVNLPYSEPARKYLHEMGMPKERTYVTGSPMAEVLHGNLDKIEASDVLDRLGLQPNKYILLSAHREENIDTDKNFTSLFEAINALAEKYDMPILYSCHPRSRKKLESSGFKLDPRVRVNEPLGFNDYNKLQMNALAIVSDSGTLPEECPQKIGCSFCAEDYDYVEDVDTVEQLWQEFIQLSGKVTSDPIPPEEMVEGVGYFQFVYADGETRTFRYASEEQGLWIGEDERCLVDGQAFYDWQERLMEAVQK